VPSAWYALHIGRPFVPLINALVYALTFLIYRRQDWPFAARAGALIAPGLVLGTVLLFVMGPFSVGLVLLFGYTLVAAAIMPRALALSSYALLVVVLSAVTIALHFGLLSWSTDPVDDTLHWMVLSLNVLFITGLVSYAFAFLLRGLESLVHRTSQMSDALAREHAAVTEANLRLEAALAAGRRLEAERRRLATAVEQAATLILILDAEWRVEYVNPAFERTTGWTREEVLGRPIDVVGGLGDDADVRAAIARALAAGAPWSGRLRNRRSDGLSYDAEAAIAPLRDDDGRVAGCVAVQRDVSREVALEAQLRQAQKLEAIGTLAGGIAHDFNNLLVPILGWTQAVRERLIGDEEVQQQLGDVLAAAERARDLVAQILAFSRKTEPRRDARPIAPIVNEASRLLRAMLPAGIHIEERIEESGAVRADPTEVHQIVMNLATNAYHAMRPAGGILTIGVESIRPDRAPAEATLQPAPAYAVITIGDTGIGMDARTLDRVFDPFFTTKEAGEGTGLGLAMVHGTVSALGGAVVVKSWPGAGTIVRVFLPCAEAAAAVAPEIARREAGGNRRILLVDDEATVRRVAQRMLERSGFVVTAVESGVEALRRLNATPDAFDVVMTDLNMPGMTGIELAHAVRLLRQNLPIVLASGYIESDVLPPRQNRASGGSCTSRSPLRTSPMRSSAL
jgi:PAS domain S-box-containing protein